MQTQSMDASNSAPEPDDAPEPPLELSPSSRGRQRKKNPKYEDFQVSEVYDGQTPPGKRPGRSLASPTVQPRAAGEEETQEEAQEEAQEEEELPKQTPKRRVGRPKKTPGRKTPGRKTSAAQNGDGATENETPKPKRKYTKRKRKEEKQEEEVKETEEPEEEEPEETRGARPKRGAAKAALKYLHILAKDELQHSNDRAHLANGDNERPPREPAQTAKTPRGPRGRGRKRKRLNSSDAEDDADFVPNAEDAEEEEDREEEQDEEQEDEEQEEEDEELTQETTRTWSSGPKVNGLLPGTLNSIAVCARTNAKFRQDCHSSCAFPDWIPCSADWQLLPRSEVEPYLPQEQRSVLFSVSREGLKKDEPRRLDRFSSLPSHADRWDSVFFCGGPVWSLEWCPTPDGCQCAQYLALACHRTMDEQHKASRVYSGPGLVQVWGLGSLRSNRRPDSKPALVYSLAQDRGFVWGLKWCPAGAWEPPDTDRQAPLLPRLGLLAVASSMGLVTVYSLPHPDALLDSLSSSERADAPAFKARPLVTLRLGSFKAPRLSDSGQVLSLDWLQLKPHDLIAVGFFDGHVGLWDLVTRSSLLRVKEADGSMTLLPYECFIAHDFPVRHVSFYPASRTLLVTAGEDRFIKTWDLTRLFEPITQQKRNLNNEICWPLFAPGLFVSEEAAYAPLRSHGVHFYDHHMSTLFPVSCTATMWSLAYSDWLNFLVTGDTLGEIVLCTLPLLTLHSVKCKRTIEKRFPLQLSSLVLLKDTEEDALPKVPRSETTAGEEEGGTGSGSAENPDHGAPEPHRRDSYGDAAKKYSLLMTDFNLRSMLNFSRRPLWKKMRSLETSCSLRLDQFPLAAVHKVRFSPNFLSQTWVASGGQSGLVRLFCVRCANVKAKPEPEETETRPGSETETETRPGSESEPESESES